MRKNNNVKGSVNYKKNKENGYFYCDVRVDVWIYVYKYHGCQ